MRVDQAAFRRLARTARLSVQSLLLLCIFASISGLAQDTPHRVLPNFPRVTDHLYRSGQPKPGATKEFANLGIKTIIDLRGDDELTRTEATKAEASGLRYLYVPMYGLSRPTSDEIVRVVATIESAENWPVFVHCKHRWDRTGTVIAALDDGWTAKQEIDQPRHLGLSWVSSA